MQARRVWGAVLSAGLALWALPGGVAALCPGPGPAPHGWHASSGRPEPRPFPPSPEPRPRHPAERPAQVRVSVFFPEAEGPGPRDGSVHAVVRIDAVEGTAERLRLTMAGHVRWERYPESCEAEGDRLSCDLGDVAGTTELRSSFRERGTAQGAPRPARTLRVDVESPDMPTLVETVRLPGGGGPDGPEREREPSREGAERRAPAPAPAESRTRTAAPARARTSAPAARTKTSTPTGRSKTSAPVGRHRTAGDGRVPEAAPTAPRTAGTPAAPALPRAPEVRPSPVEPPAAAPALPKEPMVALPPVRPTTSEAPPRLSITSGQSPLGVAGEVWPTVLAVVLAAEAALLWTVTALVLWRRRSG